MEQFQCTVCQWVYDEMIGLPESGIASGTLFSEIDKNWVCPICASGKEKFTSITPQQFNRISYFGPLERHEDVMEPDLRSIFTKAVTGEEELSSMRTVKYINLLEDILFIPGQLAKRPLRDDEADVNLKTVIGPKAKKPMEMKVPFFVSHMSFGALSREAKIALAKGSALVGTAIGSGEGGMLLDEKTAAYQYIFEYATGKFGATEEVMKQADGLEIKIGQAAKAGLGGHLPGNKVTEEIAAVRGVEPFTSIVSPANHSDIHTKEDLKRKVDWLRDLSGGVPIGIKIVAGDIDADLEWAVGSGPDFITVDCRGGATGTAPVHVKDNFGMPIPYALTRIRKYYSKNDIKDISLVITGGVRTSADIAKCLAMGADAVALGTVAMIGVGCQQYRMCHLGTCPVGVATQDPNLRKRFDIDKSAQMLANLFNVYKIEIEDYIRIVGKRDVHQLNVSDLITTNAEISNFTPIEHM